MEAVVERAITPYEAERGKPVPDLIHALIQSKLLFELRLRYEKGLRMLSELSLATVPVGTTPDLAIYPPFTPDYDDQPAQQHQPPLGCREIQAQSQRLEEMAAKVKSYFQFGVRSCWVVQPAIQGVLVFEQPGQYSFFHATDTLRDPVLNLELPLASIFA